MAPDSDPPASVTVRASKRARRVSVDRVRSRGTRSEEHTSELQSQSNLVCRLLLEKKNTSQDNPFRQAPNRHVFPSCPWQQPNIMRTTPLPAGQPILTVRTTTPRADECFPQSCDNH